MCNSRSKWQLLKICKKQEKFNELEHEKERARVQVQRKLLQINILLWFSIEHQEKGRAFENRQNGLGCECLKYADKEVAFLKGKFARCKNCHFQLQLVTIWIWLNCVIANCLFLIWLFIGLLSNEFNWWDSIDLGCFSHLLPFSILNLL